MASRPTRKRANRPVTLTVNASPDAMAEGMQKAILTNLDYRGGPASLSGTERGRCGTAVPIAQRLDGRVCIVLYRREKAKVGDFRTPMGVVPEAYLSYEAKEEVRRIELDGVIDIAVADALLTLLVRDYGAIFNASKQTDTHRWQPVWPPYATVLAQAQALVHLLRCAPELPVGGQMTISVGGKVVGKATAIPGAFLGGAQVYDAAGLTEL